MPRKSTGSTSTRSKKIATPVEPIDVQQVPAAAAAKQMAATPVVGKNGMSLDEEIRRRAYELYLQRNGQAGDPNRDWLIAEREVRARHATAGHSA